MPDQHREFDDLKPALAAGEERAFGLLLEGIGPRLYRAAMRMLSSSHDVDDVIQDVFVSLVRSRRSLRDVDDLPAYVFTVLYRTIRRLLKKQRRMPGLRSNLDEMRSKNSPVTSGTILENDLLSMAVNSLTEEQRAVIVLKTDGGLTFAEIAELMGVNHNTVASRYRYALESLRAQLREEIC